MESNVLIRNEMPTSFTCMGVNYGETRDLAMGDVALFIERDLYGYLKQVPILDPEFSVSLLQNGGISQIRIKLEINSINAVAPIRRRLENLLWAYNYQVFWQNEGKIIGELPRFEFHIDISGRDETELEIETQGEVDEQLTA